MTDKQIIDITIDDLINGNLRDMEFTAQFGVYRQAVKGLAEQLKTKEQECEELREDIKDIANLLDLDTGEEYNFGNIEMAIKDLEQECERLNKWLPIVTRLEEQFKSHEKAKGIGYKTYAEQVFTELDQLKAENETYKKMLEDEEVILALNEVRTGERHLWYNKAQRLEQALTEIKEIAEGAAEESGVFKEYFKRNNYSWKQHQLRALTCKFKAILQKISEVEDE